MLQKAHSLISILAIYSQYTFLTLNPPNTFQDEALALIETEYQALRNNVNAKEKMHIYSNILQLKVALSLTGKPEIYVDIKMFVKNYILSAEDSGFGYDSILFSKIEDRIVVADIHARITLHKYALRLLKSNGYDEQAKECEGKILLLTKEALKTRRNFSNYIHRFYLLTTQSTVAIAISLSLSVVISTILLLPSPNKNLAILKYELVNYSSIYAVNRILNTISIMTGIDDDVKIKPINIFGIILMVIGKSFFLLIIGNILFKQFKSKLNLE